jgi:hypothetical protein
MLLYRYRGKVFCMYVHTVHTLGTYSRSEHHAESGVTGCACIVQHYLYNDDADRQGRQSGSQDSGN